MINLNGALVHVAADFCGKYSPYQAIQLKPDPKGGVFIASTNAGQIAFLAFDPSGKGDENVNLLPTPDLLKATRPLKSATRWLEIEGNAARISKLTKSTTDTVESPITRSMAEAPDLVSVFRSLAELWGKDCPCVDCGNFNAGYLQKAFRAIESLGSSITLSNISGGPLRVESTQGAALVMIMPETAREVPSLPEYFIRFGDLLSL